MNRIYWKTCSMMVGLKLTNEELVSFINHIKFISPEKFKEDIKKIEMSFLNFDKNNNSYYDETNSNEMVHYNITIDKITRLLIDELKLPKYKAMDLLLKKIKEKKPDFKVSTRTRIGFSKWLALILKEVPESELLHLAYTLKNAEKNNRPFDWDIKE